jgi:hypothetical protein
MSCFEVTIPVNLFQDETQGYKQEAPLGLRLNAMIAHRETFTFSFDPIYLTHCTEAISTRFQP